MGIGTLRRYAPHATPAIKVVEEKTEKVAEKVEATAENAVKKMKKAVDKPE